MIDFSILSGIEEPQKIAAENWTNWMPKIFHKGKLEAEDHRKTYQSISLPMAEMAKIPSERLCNREFNVCLHSTLNYIAICLY